MPNTFFVVILCCVFGFSINQVLGTEPLKICESNTNRPSPMILVPGDGGCQAWTSENGKEFMLWVRIYYMLFPSNFVKYFTLSYDPSTNKTLDKIGTTVYFPGWGDTQTVEKLSSFNMKRSNYFFELVNELVKDNFYKRDFTIRGAPFDFRKTPKENPDFVEKMKLLVEETYNNAGNERVVILGHSMGNLYSLYFFQRMSLQWKKKYIRGFVATSAPLGGGTKAMQVEVSGTTVSNLASGLKFRNLVRSFPSMAWLLPNKLVFDSNKPIIQTPIRNYTINDYKELFDDLKFPEGYLMYEENKYTVNPFIAPEGIDEIYCFYNDKQETPESYIYGKKFPDVEPTIIYGEGDGTVNKVSLEVCKKWKDARTYIIPNASHGSILSNTQYIQMVKQILRHENISTEISPRLRSPKLSGPPFAGFFQ